MSEFKQDAIHKWALEDITDAALEANEKLHKAEVLLIRVDGWFQNRQILEHTASDTPERKHEPYCVIHQLIREYLDENIKVKNDTEDKS